MAVPRIKFIGTFGKAKRKGREEKARKGRKALCALCVHSFVYFAFKSFDTSHSTRSQIFIFAPLKFQYGTRLQTSTS
jgi:hypothetical protein